MEMENLTPAEERVAVVEEKKERRQIKDVEVKVEESHDYSGLKSTSEDVYAEAVWSSTKDQADLQIQRKLRLCRCLCLLLSLSCIILLSAVIILSVKIQEEALLCPKGEREEALLCPKGEREEALLCPKGEREEALPSPKGERGEEVGRGTHLCSCSLRNCITQHPHLESSPYQPCARDWLQLEDSCFFLSKKLHSWEDSRKDCRDRGGDLAVITNYRVQNFLTKEGNLLYWIGLRYKTEQWTWVNGAALTKSYWDEIISEGDCGLLQGNGLTNQSWIASPCHYRSPYICQTLQTPILLQEH